MSSLSLYVYKSKRCEVVINFSQRYCGSFYVKTWLYTSSQIPFHCQKVKRKKSYAPVTQIFRGHHLTMRAEVLTWYDHLPLNKLPKCAVSMIIQSFQAFSMPSNNFSVVIQVLMTFKAVFLFVFLLIWTVLFVLYMIIEEN